MICIVCRESYTISSFSSIHFERDEFRAVVNKIPAQVCPACGESYLDEETTAILLKKVGRFVEEGEIDVVQDYA